MSVQNLLVDAWIREAEEAARLMEDLAIRINNINPEQQHSLKDSNTTRSKLFELGAKLDRLESLLHNPPPKPILGDRDIEFRWKMLSDMQQRTRAVALHLHSSPPTSRGGTLPTLDDKDGTKTVHNNSQDYIKAKFSKTDPELSMPLVLDDATKSRKQIELSNSFALKSWLWKACRVVLMILAAAAFLFILVIICAII